MAWTPQMILEACRVFEISEILWGHDTMNNWNMPSSRQWNLKKNKNSFRGFIINNILDNLFFFLLMISRVKSLTRHVRCHFPSCGLRVCVRQCIMCRKKCVQQRIVNLD